MPKLRRAVAADHEPAGPLPLRLLPAPLRAALGVPELRYALDDRPGHGHAQHHMQPVRIESPETGLKQVFGAGPTRNGTCMANTRTAPVRRGSREEAMRRLAQKKVTPAYRPPRGNAEVDRDQLNVSVGASERLLTH